MIGQWISDIEGQEASSLRVELEDRGFGYVGRAYLFFPTADLPGFLFDLRLPKMPPYKTVATTIYLYPAGGIMTGDDRRRAEERLRASHGQLPPSEFELEFSIADGKLHLSWSATSPQRETPSKGKGIRGLLKRETLQAPAPTHINGDFVLSLSDNTGVSELKARPEISNWNEFRQWAVAQRPRQYLFRGQNKPYKLTSSFHRTWRNNLSAWIDDDTARLFGAVAEKLSYPFQPGNLQHNAAIWSILQHHGYPTPMLDWSYSPFVAAYFAYQESDEDSRPRILLFDQAQWNERYGKAGFIVDPAPSQLVVVESMAVANPRHSPQQAISTVTNIADIEEFIRKREVKDCVSYLTACDLPVESRPQIMRELELMGITYGSLFPGLDGICRDMRDRLFAPPL